MLKSETYNDEIENASAYIYGLSRTFGISYEMIMRDITNKIEYKLLPEH
jgi:hypothetical protein